MAMIGVYGGDPFYPGPSSQQVAADVRASGFTTVVSWSVHVAENGDLALNDHAVVTGGTYVGDPGWGPLLASFKEAPTSVDRVLVSVGSGPPPMDFSHVAGLLATPEGTAALATSFAALRAALPAVDGVDFDDEDDVDTGVIVGFAKLLQGVGFGQVTFCPYYSPQTWAAAWAELGGLVTGMNLQCYAGGGGNDPWDYVAALQAAGVPDAAAVVYPGLWCRHHDEFGDDGMCPPDVESGMAAWRTQGGQSLQGGWIWMYDDIQACATGCCDGPATSAAYAAAVRAGLGL
jgi:hypothetical protein